jgi:hypothetical protein
MELRVGRNINYEFKYVAKQRGHNITFRHYRGYRQRNNVVAKCARSVRDASSAMPIVRISLMLKPTGNSSGSSSNSAASSRKKQGAYECFCCGGKTFRKRP